ncbi:MAG: family 20 glycosylhydrolase, partial [Flavobacteriaceae bacterium]
NYYTQEEVKEVIEYASDRGIRVVPEFDLPGHSSSWLVGYPELGSFPNEEYKIEKKGLGIFSAILDPTKESVYDFLEGFLDEMVTLFPDQYLHLGGDEASSKTWNENSDIQQFMRENDLSDSKELQNYFTKRVQKITSDKGKTMIGWNEILNPNLPKEQILIQSWTNHKSLWDAIKQGHNAILSSGFYLDHKKSAATHYKVDPTVIPGAINIEIDSTKWKSWDTFIEFNETIIEGQLFLFGENENTKAIMELRDSPVGVDQVNRNGNKIQFELNSDVGKIDISFEIKGDSILGSANISILELALSGARTGGNDMPGGTPLPEFKKIEPLTPVQESRILGGEACMWSETVDSRTIESRIWPRAAAIAEKLWSPKIETDQVSDMYRRLKVLDRQLENRGIQHTTASIEIIEENIPVEFIKSIKELIDVLQEDYFMNRLNIYGGIENFFTYTPLNRMVDAAFPESLKAHTFNETVQNWSKTKNKQLEKVLVIQLEKWIENHQKLIPLFEENSPANEIRLHSKHLAILSKAALRKIKGLESDQDVKQVIEQSKINYGGTLLAVVDGLVSLIQDE